MLSSSLKHHFSTERKSKNIMSVVEKLGVNFYVIAEESLVNYTFVIQTVCNVAPGAASECIISLSYFLFLMPISYLSAHNLYYPNDYTAKHALPQSFKCFFLLRLCLVILKWLVSICLQILVSALLERMDDSKLSICLMKFCLRFDVWIPGCHKWTNWLCSSKMWQIVDDLLVI